MTKTIYVANVSYQATENDLVGLFEKVGEVRRVHIVIDKATGLSKGFAFVEMKPEDASQAITQFDQTIFMGRTIAVRGAYSGRSEPTGRRTY